MANLWKECAHLLYSQGRDRLALYELNKGTLVYSQVYGQGSLRQAIATAAKLLQSCLTLCDPIEGSAPGSLRPWDSPGKNTGVGCHFLLHFTALLRVNF